MAHLQCRHRAHALQDETTALALEDWEDDPARSVQLIDDAKAICRNEGYVHGSLATYPCIRDAVYLLKGAQ
jgi:hypothetical protein